MCSAAKVIHSQCSRGTGKEEEKQMILCSPIPIKKWVRLLFIL